MRKGQPWRSRLALPVLWGGWSSGGGILPIARRLIDVTRLTASLRRVVRVGGGLVAVGLVVIVGRLFGVGEVRDGVVDDDLLDVGQGVAEGLQVGEVGGAGGAGVAVGVAVERPLRRRRRRAPRG